MQLFSLRAIFCLVGTLRVPVLCCAFALFFGLENKITICYNHFGNNMGLTEKHKKLIIFIVSLLLVAFITLMFFLDTSLEWNAIKILSCVVVDIWSFFVIASFRYIYLKYKNMTIQQSVAIALHIMIYGFFFPILLSPYYGLRYFFNV